MTIAINSTSFITSAGNDFILNHFLKLSASKPEHQFIFIISPAASANRVSGNFKNIIYIISSPRANNPLMWKIWLNYTLPGIAKKYRADLLIHTNGTCSRRTRLPQLLFISDLSHVYFPQFISKNQLNFLRKNTPAFLEKATSIITASEYLTKGIIKKYSINKQKIITVDFIATDLYQPIQWKAKEAIKEKYTEGKEYFLFSGDIHPKNNLLNLLKAFSFFKKRQKSNMQLIVTSRRVPANDPFIENFRTYKYRKEVTLLTDLPEHELAQITAAAYAFIYPVLYDGMTLNLLQAIQCEVPVVASNTGAINELPNDAVLYADPGNFEDIADKMMLLFKDENKRNDLINKGKQVIREENYSKLNEHLWNAIDKAVGFNNAEK